MNVRASSEDTIVAISTPPGEGGIGIVRLSGEKAASIAGSLFESPSGPVSAQPSHTARFGRVIEKADGSLKTVDEALLLLMRAPKSYTGEDVVEIQAHGSQPVLQKIVELALEAGARLAEPGEFTKRAFLNGRMDLLQAEAVLDLIQARTERSRQWAVSQLEGGLSRKMQAWKEELVRAMSHLEASVDFPDDHPDTESIAETRARLERLSGEAARLLKDSELVFLAKRGFKTVLWGRPNVGKSSLLNRLTRSERVIVTPYPGTTRDMVEQEAVIGGFAVRFQDTAGIRDTDHPIEKEGVERSRKALAGADLILWVLDSSEPLNEADRIMLQELEGRPVIAVLNKSDLPSRLDAKTLASALPAAWPKVSSSCVKEEGTHALEKAILSSITRGETSLSEESVLSTARQKDLLEKVSKDLGRAIEACRQGLSGELIAADVRQALDRLGEMVGEVVTDDILESLFQQFCIGK
jgi:tRNA modification GTPase